MTHSSPAKLPSSDGKPDPRPAPRHPGHCADGPTLQHWLSAALVERSSDAWGATRLSPYVIDVEGEIAFWSRHYQATLACHRGVLPFPDYVPALRFGISLFLQCHDYDLAAMGDEQLAMRYARVRRNSQVEWHEARKVVQAAYLRLHARWQAQSGPRALTGRDGTPCREPRAGARRRPATARRTD